MKRPLAMFERAMYLNGDFHVNVMVTARIRGCIAEQRMQQALARVQAKHSVLRCLIVQECNRPGFVMQDRPTPIPLRITERRNDDDWVEVSMHESLQRFDGSRMQCARMLWMLGTAACELMRYLCHDIC